MPGTSRRSQPSAGGGGWRTRSVMRTLRSLPASHVSPNTFESISVLPSGSVKGILASPSESTAPLPADAAFTTTSTLLPAGALRRYTVCAEPIPVVATITAAVIATSRHRFAIRSPLAQPIISVRLTFPRRVRIYSPSNAERSALRPPHHREGSLVLGGRRRRALAGHRPQRDGVHARECDPHPRAALQGLGAALHAVQQATGRRPVERLEAGSRRLAL